MEKRQKLCLLDLGETSTFSTSGAGMGAMKRIKPYVSRKSLQDVYKTLIQPHSDFCSPLRHNCGWGLQDKLQKFQNRAARVITGADVMYADVRSRKF